MRVMEDKPVNICSKWIDYKTKSKEAQTSHAGLIQATWA